MSGRRSKIAATLIRIILILGIVPSFVLAAQQTVKPPPGELFFGQSYHGQAQVREYGTGTVRIEWKARRSDYDWRRVSEKYREFYEWYEKTKEELEEKFASSSGRERINAAFKLFEFALEAEKKKEELDGNELYSGQWEGKADIDVVMGVLGEAHFSLNLTFTTRALTPGGLYPVYAVTGEGKNGSYRLKGEIFIGAGAPEAKVDVEQTLSFSAGISGKFISSQNLVLLDVRPQNIKGKVRGEMSSRLGTLTSIGTLKGGTWSYSASWPEMEALITYLGLITGSLPQLDLSHRESLPENEIFGDEQLDGSLNWQPEELQDIKHEYFRRWFDTFWQVLNAEIAAAEDTKARADLGRELYQDHVKKAHALGLQHGIRRDVMDHCRLWPARAGSSFDGSFKIHFRWMDSWHDEEIGKAAGPGEKRNWSRVKFDYSLEATSNFDLKYLSGDLRDELKLWLAREDSYIDKSFKNFFDYHNAYWKNEVAGVSGFEAKDARAEGYFGDVPFIIEFGQMGVLSSKLIDDLKIIEGLKDGYADDVFVMGWSLGLQHFEGQLPEPPKTSKILENFEAWMLKKLILSQYGFVSDAVASMVEARWEALLDAYPPLRQKYGLEP